jgi:hypothetical protein
MAALRAYTQVERAAALFTLLRARLGYVVRDVSALSVGSREEFHLDLS